jgi:hypothetical protein
MTGLSALLCSARGTTRLYALYAHYAHESACFWGRIGVGRPAEGAGIIR